MANNFLDDNGLLYFWQKIKNVFATKTELANSKTTVEDNLKSTSTTNALSANQGRVLDEKIGAINTNMENLGAGDMLKSRYDVDNNGKVDAADKADDADKFGGQSPSYYAKATDLNGYVPTSQVGQASGVASLGSDGKVPTSQLPETAPIEHTHSMDDIDGLNEAAEGLNEALEEAVSDMSEIANGKCASYVFETVDELDTWLGNSENTEKLKVGDVFLIKATDVPDYWWDGSGKSKLETTKVTLTTITNAEIDEIVASE